MFSTHDSVEWPNWNINAEEIPSFREEEVKEAAQKMKNKKTPRIDRIISELVKATISI